MAICVQTRNLTKCYGSTVAVSGVNLEIETGEVFGLLGPNGAGKSTTLHMLTGLIRPTAGAVSLFGKSLRSDFLEVIRRVGVLVERPSFYDYLSARKNLLLINRLSGRQVTVDRALDRVGLLGAANRKVRTFSHGMRQRLGLAQAILTEPELLILDEPANALDPESSKEMLHLLRFLADEAKVTVVLASHMLHDVETLCDRIAILNRGRLAVCEPTQALLSYDPTWVDVLLDSVEAAAKRLREESWVESVETGPGRLSIRLRERDVHHLTAFLIGAGYRLSGVIPHRRTLQDYFLKVLNA